MIWKISFFHINIHIIHIHTCIGWQDLILSNNQRLTKQQNKTKSSEGKSRKNKDSLFRNRRERVNSWVLYGKIAPKDLLALSYILSGIYSCDDFRVGFAPQTKGSRFDISILHYLVLYRRGSASWKSMVRVFILGMYCLYVTPAMSNSLNNFKSSTGVFTNFHQMSWTFVSMRGI